MVAPHIKNIFARLRHGAHLVTVNSRLSYKSALAYDIEMREEGRLVWETPVMLPLGAWTMRLRRSAKGLRPRMSEDAAETIWRKIASAEDPLYGARTAKEAFRAHAIVKEYGINLGSDLFLAKEAQALKRWQGKYESELRRLRLADPADINKEVKELILRGDIVLPKEVYFAGFDEVSPALKSIFDALVSRGVKVEFLNDDCAVANTLEGSVELVACEDQSDEATSAARWARQNSVGEARLAIIVPELNKYKDLVRREFEAELNPARVLPWKEGRDVFNVSLGSRLIDEPLVSSALRLLSLDSKVLVAKAFGALLSPYFAGSGEQYMALSSVEAAFKNDNRTDFSLKEVITALMGAGHKQLAKRVLALASALDGFKGTAGPAKWSETFSRSLAGCGWLKELSLSSGEYQALSAWAKLLERFASMDEPLGQMSKTEAIVEISALASSTIHQSETPECRVEVLGLLEATGLSFDAIWIMGAHANALPPLYDPNPFIPIHMQKAANVRGACPKAGAQAFQRTLAGLINASHSVVVSYPRTTDKAEARVSPLVKAYANKEESTPERAIASSRLKDAIQGQRALEVMVEKSIVPMGASELGAIRGGTSILKEQSACPFKAFATYRLNATLTPEPELGISSLERGTVLHVSLKLFWESIGSLAELNKLQDSGLIHKRVEEIVGQATTPISARGKEAFVELEKARLVELLLEWAGVEAKRAEFSIKAIETPVSIDLHGLRLNGRIDRIDDIGGVEAIVDYKSGETNKRLWAGHRPEDPQLQIYCLAKDAGAISFAAIKPGGCKFIGLSQLEGVLPGVNTIDKERSSLKGEAKDWRSLMEKWKEVVGSLAQEFVDGYCAVDPNTNWAQLPCKRCDLRGLCRIEELGPNVFLLEDDGGASGA